uniref:Ovule protein n=1 Tax=Panagrolaimus sp. ES5 TaxID=591445 RepID=A0AC34GT31_9BILA
MFEICYQSSDLPYGFRIVLIFVFKFFVLHSFLFFKKILKLIKCHKNKRGTNSSFTFKKDVSQIFKVPFQLVGTPPFFNFSVLR